MVVSRLDQQMQELVTDSLTVLCKAKLPFDKQIKIEGLLAITLDCKEVIVVNVNDIIFQKLEKRKFPPVENSCTSATTQTEKINAGPTENGSSDLLSIEDSTVASTSFISVPMASTYTVPVIVLPMEDESSHEHNAKKMKVELTVPHTQAITDHDYTQLMDVKSIYDPSTKVTHAVYDLNDQNKSTENKKNQQTDVEVIPTYRCTDYRARSSFHRFEKFLNKTCNHQINNILAIEPKKMDDLLGRWFWSLKTESGEDFRNHKNLKVFHRGLNRFLVEEKYGYDILKDKEFKNSRDTVRAKLAMLKRINGSSCLPKETTKVTDSVNTFTHEEITLLWDDGVFGTDNAVSLLNTVYWMVSCTFGLRNPNEHHVLRWGDIKWKVDELNKTEYIICSEQVMKRQFILPQNHFVSSPVYDENSLYIIKEYNKRRPPSMNLEGSPFYLHVRQEFDNKTDIWYKTQGTGVKDLNNLHSRIMDTIRKYRNSKRPSEYRLYYSSSDNDDDTVESELEDSNEIETTKKMNKSKQDYI